MRRATFHWRAAVGMAVLACASTAAAADGRPSAAEYAAAAKRLAETYSLDRIAPEHVEPARISRRPAYYRRSAVNPACSKWRSAVNA